METIHFIVVIIPKWNFYTVIFEDEFIQKNACRTQNEIIEVLKTLGLKYEKDFTCDLCTKDFRESEEF